MAFIPRKDRDQARGIRAAAAVHAAGGGAMAQSLAHIEATFHKASYGPNNIKRACEASIRRGAQHFETRGRFYKIARQVEDAGGAECPIEDAILLVEALYGTERLEIILRADLGWPGSFALQEKLKEARLLLRWLRARGFSKAFPQIFEVLTTPLYERAPDLLFAEAAE